MSADSLHEVSDPERIEGFLHGDAQAHREIRGWVERIVRLHAWRLRSNEDLVQDVLYELLRNLGAGRFEGRSALKTYVERVAKYRCIDAIRRARLRMHRSLEESGEPEPAHNDHPERRAAANEEIRRAYAVLALLPEPCRKLLKRLLADETPYEELAVEYGVAIGTIKSRVARCRKRAHELRRQRGGSQ